jgi:20S proteasome subunit beta 6
MSAMFSQNPLMNGPNYSFNQSATASAGIKEHAFYP